MKLEGAKDFKDAERARRQAAAAERRGRMAMVRAAARRLAETQRFKASPGSELARLRRQCHETFDPLWSTGRITRSGMYRQLARLLGLPAEYCHFGMFDCETCRRALAIATHPAFTNLPPPLFADPMAEPD